MKFSSYEQLAAQAIGLEVMKHFQETLKELEPKVGSTALQTLEEIRRILDDHSFDDSECFHRIEAIVSALEENGIHTTRHDW